jgi:hypothetical protein
MPLFTACWLFCCGHAALLFVGEMRAWGDFRDLNRCIWRDAYDEIIQSTSNPTLWRTIRKSPYTFLRIVGVIFLVNFIILGQKYTFDGSALSIFFIFFILWLWIGEKLSDVPLIQKRRNKITQLIIIFAPIAIAFFLALGYDNAITQASNIDATGLVTLNNNDKLSVNIMRSFDSGLLFKDPIKKEMAFLPWSEIRRIDMPYKQKLFYKGFITIGKDQ